MVHGWFLHQSENLLIRGSQKATRFVPSKIPLQLFAGIAATEVDWQLKIPEPYCPADRCLLKRCYFYLMNIPSCKNHRNRCKPENPETDFGKKFQKAYKEMLDKQK